MADASMASNLLGFNHHKTSLCSSRQQPQGNPALDYSARRRAVRGGRVRVEAAAARARCVGGADRVSVSSDVKQRPLKGSRCTATGHKSEKTAAIVHAPSPSSVLIASKHTPAKTKVWIR